MIGKQEDLYTRWLQCLAAQALVSGFTSEGFTTGMNSFIFPALSQRLVSEKETSSIFTPCHSAPKSKQEAVSHVYFLSLILLTAHIQSHSSLFLRPAGEHRPQLRLLLLGGAQTGKSRSGNTILGDEVFQTGEETTHSMVIYKETRGRRLTVVDTPPWAGPTHSTAGGDGGGDGGDEGGGGGDGAAVQSEQASIEGPFMGAILCPPGPHALLLVMSVSQPFTEVQRKAAEDQDRTSVV